MRIGPLVALVILAGIGAAGWYWLKDQPAPTSPPGGGGRRSAQLGDGPVPVTVEIVKKETVPVYRQGIGNVQALSTVTVRSQIDGRLISVDFVEGQNVRKGDALARIDPAVYKAQYDQAIAKKAQDEATLANARIDLQRYKTLAQENAGPKQQADQQAALVAQLEAQVRADDAAIDNAKAVLDYTVIAAPIDGRAGLRQVDSGNIVHAADASGLVVLTQVNPIATIFTLPQRDLAVISSALARGEVQVEVLESGGGEVLVRGSLQTLDNLIDISTGTIKLKAVFPNEDQKLWPGQFVSARVVVDTLVDAKVVATPAIRRGPAGTFVYTVGADNRVSVHPVNVLVQDEVRSVIGDGVEIGDRVVTVGFAQLSDGKAVHIPGDAAPAGPNAEGASKGGHRPDGSGGGQRQHRKDAGASNDTGQNGASGTKEVAR